MTEQELFDKYPKIFQRRFLPLTVSCMYWGVACSETWYGIIDKLCGRIQQYVDENHIPQVEAEQIKSKYGGLRFYTDCKDSNINKFIEDAEGEVLTTCEDCGATEGVATKRIQGWYSTLCPSCVEKRKTRGTCRQYIPHEG